MLFLTFFVIVALGNAGLGYASFVVLRRRLAHHAGAQPMPQSRNPAPPNPDAGN